MFKFLKEKLKQAASLFSRKVEKEAEEKIVEEEIPAKKDVSVKKDAIEKKPLLKKEASVSKAVKVPEKKKEVSVEKAIKILEPRKETKETKKEEPKNAEKKKEEKKAKKLKFAKTVEEDIEELKKETEVDEIVSEAEELESETETFVEEKERAIEEKVAESTAEKKTLPKEQASVAEAGAQADKEKAAEADSEEKKEEPKKEKKGFFKKLFGKKEKKEGAAPEKTIEKETPPKKQASVPEAVTEPAPEADSEEEQAEAVLPKETEEEHKEEPAEEEEEKQHEKLGFFERLKQKIVTKVLSDEKFEELFFELEVALLENNVALEVVDKIKADLKKELVGVPIPRGKVDETILATLRESIEGLFTIPAFELSERAKKKKPFVIAFVGVNGSGKTTTIAKVAHYLKKNKLTSVISASDTFRAAAIDQLGKHAEKLGIKMIKHDYGSDPAAVAFDAISYAKAHNVDVVLVDTAGRQHSDANLMDELKKIKRVAKPDVTLFIGESITGNDCVEQARQFNQAVELDGIILSKADVDEKGGAAISVSYVTGKPILFLGTGQGYDDLTPFSKEFIMENIGL